MIPGTNRSDATPPLGPHRVVGRRFSRAGFRRDRLAALVLGGAAWVPAGLAPAVEPVLPEEPLTLREMGPELDVVDAADDRDPFDLVADLHYQLEFEDAEIAYKSGQPMRFTRVTSILWPSVSIGMFRDLAARIELPIVLSDTRSLTERGELFDHEFRPPERSGIRHLGLSIEYGVLNPMRDPEVPALTLRAKTRLSVGVPFHACNDYQPLGEVRCAAAADKNRNGLRDPGEVPQDDGLEPGFSRQTATLSLSASIARRWRAIEPFGTVEGSVEVPFSNSPLSTEVLGADAPLPPITGTFAAGLGILPWENRSRFSRLWIDAAGILEVSSRGVDVTPLFDLLGSSSSVELRTPVAGSYQNGVTEIGARAILSGRARLVWRAGERVELRSSVELRHEFNTPIAEAECATCAYFRPSVLALGLHREKSFSFALAAGGGLLF